MLLRLVVGGALLALALPVSRACLRFCRHENAIVSSSATSPRRLAEFVVVAVLLVYALPQLFGVLLSGLVHSGVLTRWLSDSDIMYQVRG